MILAFLTALGIPPSMRLGRTDTQTLTFIGEYFGIDAVNNFFAVLWTDTRTGVQELFFDSIATSGYRITQELERSDTGVLAGVIDDSGGFIWVNGKVIPYPGPGPGFDLLNALAALDSVKKISHPNSYKIVNSITNVMQNVLKDMRSHHKAVPRQIILVRIKLNA